MEMMFERGGQALKDVGDSESHPTDWLIFLCPGMVFENSTPGQTLKCSFNLLSVLLA